MNLLGVIANPSSKSATHLWLTLAHSQVRQWREMAQWCLTVLLQFIRQVKQPWSLCWCTYTEQIWWMFIVLLLWMEPNAFLKSIKVRKLWRLLFTSSTYLNLGSMTLLMRIETGQIFAGDHCSGLLFFTNTMWYIMSTMSFNSQFLSTSWVMLSGAELLRCLKVDFALAYSYSVIGSSSIFWCWYLLFISLHNWRSAKELLKVSKPCIYHFPWTCHVIWPVTFLFVVAWLTLHDSTYWPAPWAYCTRSNFSIISASRSVSYAQRETSLSASAGHNHPSLPQSQCGT